MPEPKRHHTKSKVGRRRSHQALKKTNVQICASCKAPALPHRVCSNCGEYKKAKN
ncbi:MAG: 50S ribosomal protein L32 [Candidatus Colwellbacteria bacterium CG10_big_fil_rev_8_21_14_0_10_42_22]|uniref:Large ribosomal subunit protein bL32 n=1 Tax=Candidatus Colwellbacteria bacterium CG10_big_fil_rev_8_21_14_0_10_42_22 TaxID=1974540 RepID=A0A2H0VF53_9BACT|nr:MAG: 50S ribosomal protein L32 [Candidatus Colwellbacteria bacterium CG10_big_fil_rev_8_21_14_0_10_42_22]